MILQSTSYKTRTSLLLSNSANSYSVNFPFNEIFLISNKARHFPLFEFTCQTQLIMAASYDTFKDKHISKKYNSRTCYQQLREQTKRKPKRTIYVEMTEEELFGDAHKRMVWVNNIAANFQNVSGFDTLLEFASNLAVVDCTLSVHYKDKAQIVFADAVNRNDTSTEQKYGSHWKIWLTKK